MPVKARSLLVQVLAVNALLVAATVLVAALAARAGGGEQSVAVLGAALLATLAGNWLLLERRFLPLERLIDAMEEVEEAAPGHRVAIAGGGSDEVERLTAAYQRMLGRLEHERREAGLATVRAQERERQRIAQDLHDEVNQALTAILLRLEAARLQAPPGLRTEMDETKRLATQAMGELLQLARQLRPTVLDDHGLVPALHTQVEDFGRQSGLRARLRIRGQAPRLSPEQQLAIYRVLQESLSNVAQHAGATAVEVELSFVGRTTLTVTDDGRGFTTGRAGGLGLSGMRERALLAGGRLVIWSEPGQGTRVELLIAPQPAIPAPTPPPVTAPA
jgi:two-component system sensor histidine kinase UhpB